ncbi:uncharacterized protein LOC143275237 [Babylonia areolata]|uniref:uncharacterized protein LOC143275237 n=1 Tax=Babylonia areolata TaxID=304850 RepID=UPI003FCF2F8D
MEYLPNLTDSFVTTLLAELNDSSSLEEEEELVDSSGYTLVHNIQTICVPIFFVSGLLGNLLALGCFLSQPLRGASCCLYMAGKCVSDTAFLAVVFVMWLYRLNVDLINVQGVCQLTVFLSYVSGFTSVWLVVAVTYENYVRICRPHLSKTHCTRRVAVIIIAVIVVVAALFYSFALWTNTFKDVLMVMTFIDTAMTLVLPSLLMVPLVLATLLAVARSADRKKRLRDSLLRKRCPRDLFRNSVEAKVARFLLAVSLTFLLLHTPGHLIRLKLLVHQYILHKAAFRDSVLLQLLLQHRHLSGFRFQLPVSLSRHVLRQSGCLQVRVSSISYRLTFYSRRRNSDDKNGEGSQRNSRRTVCYDFSGE